MKRLASRTLRRNAVPFAAAIVLVVATLFAVSACSKDATASTTQTPDLWGEVTDVSGNQVTLKLLAIPTGGIPTGGFNRPTGGFNRPSGGVRPTGGADVTGGASPTGGVVPTGGWPTGGAFPSGGVRPTGGAGRGLAYTGEEKTVIIPVGVKITQTTYDTSGAATTVTVDISEVKVGNFLMIYYGSNGKSIAKVTLSTTARTGRGGFGGGGFPSGFPTGGFPGDGGFPGGDGQPPQGG